MVHLHVTSSSIRQRQRLLPPRLRDTPIHAPDSHVALCARPVSNHDTHAEHHQNFFQNNRIVICSDLRRGAGRASSYTAPSQPSEQCVKERAQITRGAAQRLRGSAKCKIAG